LLAPLVLRMDGEDSGYSRKNYQRFRRHRVLRDIPRHSRQRRRPIRRPRRRTGLRRVHRHLPAPSAIVVAMPRMPRSICFAVPGSLALRSATRPLPVPQRAHPAGTIVGTRSTVASCAQRPRPSPDHRAIADHPVAAPESEPSTTAVGHFWRAGPGHFWKASKARTSSSAIHAGGLAASARIDRARRRRRVELDVKPPAPRRS
jgi:hypothetical protein